MPSSSLASRPSSASTSIDSPLTSTAFTSVTSSGCMSLWSLDLIEDTRSSVDLWVIVTSDFSVNRPTSVILPSISKARSRVRSSGESESSINLFVTKSLICIALSTTRRLYSSKIDLTLLYTAGFWSCLTSFLLAFSSFSATAYTAFSAVERSCSVGSMSNSSNSAVLQAAWAFSIKLAKTGLSSGNGIDRSGSTCNCILPNVQTKRC